MIKISYEEITSKIKEKAGLKEEEIESKISKKLRELSGLISKEGAAHIVANELGIKIFEQLSGKLQIKNILAGMRDVETTGKVLQIYDAREFGNAERSGKVGSLTIGDETGTVRIVMWGSQTDNLSRLREGDVVKIIGGYVRENFGRKEVHLNDRSQIIINPKGEEINVNVSFVKRKKINEINESDEVVEVLGTLVQVFEPRFFETCPSCGRRIKMEGTSFVCQAHNAVAPDYSCVLNTVIDDGSETIRAVFFRQNAAKLLNTSMEALAYLRENPPEFVNIKKDIEGKIVKLSGKVNKNALYGRIELVAQKIDTNPNPGEELKRLEKESV